jgi:anti-anti-sigma factor
VTSDVRVDDRGPWPVVRLRGEIDLSNADALAEVAEGAVPNSAKGLVLDLSGVTYLDSTGLRLIFRLARRLGDRQQALRLVVPEGARIARVLTFAGVSTVAEVLPTYDPDASDH